MKFNVYNIIINIIIIFFEHILIIFFAKKILIIIINKNKNIFKLRYLKMSSNNNNNNNNNSKNSQILQNLFKSTFESYKNNLSKKEKNYQIIKNFSQNINIDSYEKLNELCIYLTNPCEKFNIKIMDKLTDALNVIYQNDLIPEKILQEMSDRFLKNVLKYFQSNPEDHSIEIKILNTIKQMYFNKKIFLHNQNLKYVIKLHLKIYLMMKLNRSHQIYVPKIMGSFIEFIIKNVEPNSNEKFKEFWLEESKNNNNINNIDPNSSNENKKKILEQIQLNMFKFISKKYLDFMIDLIEIQNNNNNDIINKFIKIIQNNNYQSLKSEIENLNLEKIDFYYELKSKNYKMGKFGFCILCRMPANFFSEKIFFPFCEKNSQCEIEMMKYLNNVLFRSDYLNLLIYFSLTSSLLSDDKNNETEVNVDFRKFCLDAINEMILKGSKNFINDPDVIFIIKEFLKDSLLKNTLTNDIDIYKLSLQLFMSIIINFRGNLKEEIEIFFMKILIAILESENFIYVFKDAILEILLKCADDCSILVEIYVNYDCDVNYHAVFSDLINLLTKIINGLYRTPKFQNTFNKPLQENLLTTKTLDFFNKFIHRLNELVEKNMKNYYLLTNNNNSNKEIESVNANHDNFNNTTEDNFINDSNNNSNILSLNNTNDEIKDKITKSLKIKKLLERAIEVFNISNSSGDCLKYLKKEKMVFDEDTFNAIKNKYIELLNNEEINIYKNAEVQNIIQKNPTVILDIDNNENTLNLNTNDDNNFSMNIFETPFIISINPLLYFFEKIIDKNKITSIKYDDYLSFEISRFIRSNLKELKRDKVGDYLCGSKDIQKSSVTYFINSFNFKHLHILEALRVLFIELPLSGEGQIIDRIVSIFGNKYYKENPTVLPNPDVSYYLAFSIIMLNTDLHREEVSNKYSKEEYINRFLSMIDANDKVDRKYLEDIYNQVLKDPLVIPGQKLSVNNNNKKKNELFKQERENIMKQTVNKLENLSNTKKNKKYITNIDNDNIKHLIELSWSNFLYIFSQLLADTDNEKIIQNCIENILTMARTCGILHLNTCTEAFINTIINLTNLNEIREIGYKNIESIKALIDFTIESGQYIRAGWVNILNIISKINYLQQTENEKIKEDIRKRPRLKNVEKEINITLNNKEIINKSISEDSFNYIYGKTEFFDEEAILNFVESLCKISENELKSYEPPKLLSLYKLIEVAYYNMKRIQIEWTKIWKLIKDHFVNVITDKKNEIIWNTAFENLRQITCGLLEKRDITILNFQQEFFKPYQIIFKKTLDDPNRSELVLIHINFIVGTFSKSIHTGWIIIFDILKMGLSKNNEKLNDNIKTILENISKNFRFTEVDNDVFRGYVECLCYIYLNKNMREFAFNTIINLLSNFIKSIEDKEDNKERKKNIFLKNFFYGLDELIKKDGLSHMNLLFEIINNNENIFFNKNNNNDFNTIIYVYYMFFKPHLLSMIFYNDENENEENNNNNNNNNNEKDAYKNRINEESILINSHLMNDINSDLTEIEGNNDLIKNRFCIENENKEEINRIIKVLKHISFEFKEENDTSLIEKKLFIINCLDEKNYEITFENFIEKFKKMFFNNNDNKKYNFFYENILISMLKYCVYNKNGKVLKILIKFLNENFSEKFYNSIHQQNINIVNLLENINFENDNNNKCNIKNINDLIKFENEYSNFIKNFKYDIFNNNDKEKFNVISNIFCKILEIYLNNNNKINKKFINDFTNVLNNLQIIREEIINKNNNIINEYEKENLIFNNMIKIFNDNNNNNNNIKNNENYINIIIFEIEKILNLFLKVFDEKSLENVFENLMDLTETDNNKLRTSSKNLIKLYIKYKLFVFKKYNDNNK